MLSSTKTRKLRSQRLLKSQLSKNLYKILLLLKQQRNKRKTRKTLQLVIPLTRKSTNLTSQLSKLITPTSKKARMFLAPTQEMRKSKASV